MDIKQFKVLVLLVLTTVASAGDPGCPAGHAYIEVMGRCSLDQYEAIVGTLIKVGWVTKSGSHVLKITPAGQAVFKKVAAAIAA